MIPLLSIGNYIYCNITSVLKLLNGVFAIRQANILIALQYTVCCINPHKPVRINLDCNPFANGVYSLSQRINHTRPKKGGVNGSD